MKKSGALPSQPEPNELKFPDWSGMDDSSARVSCETAFRLCEEYAQRYPALRRRREEQKCEVEFVL